uniref:Zn(2)-C6 fungal-type domain-containing protein n=1 Tax=Strombidinopsis acuminata TaxID=141414 RepID=A0A7S3TDG7_9SPIT|mmetsp:Transcript_62716/g.86670  ORF Transcript_62716/g.86670 Transcript_62716/m.86670 type:complete len:221 (+) Transcript_62716:2-664(+)
MEPIEKLSFYPSGERKRCKTACVNCRETRIRCVMLRCGSCSSCVEQGIPCVERVSKKRGPAPKPKQGAEERNHAVEPTHGGQKRARSPLPPRPPVVSPWLQAPSIVPPPAAIAPQWGCPSTVLPHAAPTNDHSVWSRLAAMQGTFLHTTHARRPPLPHAMISHSHPGLLNACSSAMQLPFPFQMPGGVDAPPRGAWGGQLLGPSPYPEVNMGFSGVPRPT